MCDMYLYAPLEVIYNQCEDKYNIIGQCMSCIDY